MSQLNIAVVGSGISGLSAAWLLSKRHRVTVYEAEPRLGGHANTLDVETADGPVAVDSGFIVYNEPNYPNLTALLSRLGVPTAPTEMTFALSLDGGAYEYSGSGAGGFFGQPRNLISRRHWRLLADTTRFFRTAKERIGHYRADMPLGDFLAAEGYSDVFVADHIVPMGAAIWSTNAATMLAFPATSFIHFYASHGMLQFRDRPLWRTVSGGSRVYVERLIADAGVEVQRENGVARISRHARYIHIVDSRGSARPFDHVVVATHADQALALLGEPDPLEDRRLGAFSYQANRAVLHRDPRLMPRRRRLWSSWNYLKSGAGLDAGMCVTYWMNRLQNLPTRTNLFVTLNPSADIHPKAVDAEIGYRHPVFTAETRAAQGDLWAIQGHRRTWYCGSYFGYGFHEDGAQSGLAVAEQLGGLQRPWQVSNAGSRIALPPAAAQAAE